MRFLHTADWHLGDRLGRIDRTGDLRAAVDRIAVIVQHERVDVLIIAGDLFSELARPDTLREAVAHWQMAFGPFLARGGTILAITGNHDNETFCQTLRHAMALAAPLPPTGDLAATGRLYLAAEPSTIRLQIPGDAFAVSFVLMPYPTASRYPSTAGKPSGEKHLALAEEFTRTLIALREACPPEDPAVLVAHITVRGANLAGGLFRVAPSTDVAIDSASLFERFTYVALGHIHKPQAIGGYEHLRYSGSIERLDLGEQHDQKCVVLGELGPQGLVGTPRELDLPATKVYEVSVEDPAIDLPALNEDHLSAITDLVKLTIRYDSSTDILDDVLTELERLYPRWYLREWSNKRDHGPSMVKDSPDPTQSFAETVLGYFQKEVVFESDAEQAAVTALVQELLDKFETP